MTRDQATLDFLARRRSTPPKLMTGPAPDRSALLELLTLASRSPDHGMLVPWRFVVLSATTLRATGAAIRELGAALGTDPAAIDKAAAVYATSPLAVAVIAAPQAGAKVPVEEQILAVGGVCLGLVNAAIASGWAAGWVSGWVSHDRAFLPALLDLAPHETIAGLVHIGSGPVQADRPRPDVAAITSWRGE